MVSQNKIHQLFLTLFLQEVTIETFSYFLAYKQGSKRQNSYTSQFEYCFGKHT